MDGGGLRAVRNNGCVTPRTGGRRCRASGCTRLGRCCPTALATQSRPYQESDLRPAWNAAACWRERDGAVLVDIRSEVQRAGDGLIPGAIFTRETSLNGAATPGRAMRGVPRLGSQASPPRAGVPAIHSADGTPLVMDGVVTRGSREPCSQPGFSWKGQGGFRPEVPPSAVRRG